MANPRDLATMTMYRYTKYWFVKNITESFTSFVLFSSTVLKSLKKKSVRIGVISFKTRVTFCKEWHKIKQFDI